LESRESRKRWGLALLSAVIVTLIAIAPQVHFSLSRGRQWNGAYAQTHGDEAVYAAYLAALIDGRPRRNNPYSGRDDSPAHPVAESVFSVQLLPPFLIAGTARRLHLSAARTFMALTGVTAFTSALAVFWLLAMLVKEDRVAAVGVLVVLLGSSASLILEYLLRAGDSNNYLPFLRRYLPSFPFPVLCVYCALTWQMLAAGNKRLALKYALGAGFLFGVLTFSYVYHWSFAVVWTFCLAAIWLVTRRSERKDTLQRIAFLLACMAAALIPYLLLLSKLGATTGEVHFLAATRAPDFFRLIEILGLVILAITILLAARRRVKASDPEVIFILASALTPFVLFNQQVLTGRSLQPFHYEVFVGSYMTVLAAFVTIVIGWRTLALLPAPRRSAFARLLLVGAAFAAILSGSAEATLMSRRQYQGNLFRDEARPALLRLAQIGREDKDGVLDTRSIVYSPNFVVTGAVASTAPQPVLWAQHMFVFPDVSLAEDKERLAQFLYYQGVVFTDIDRYHWQSLDGDRKYYLTSLIGRGRFNPRLTVDWHPITPEEVQGALDYYANFVATFDRTRAASPQVSYLLVAADELKKLSNFDRWYERDQGEQLGSYVLFRVRLRD
jgi:hypothetical protein